MVIIYTFSLKILNQTLEFSSCVTISLHGTEEASKIIKW